MDRNARTWKWISGLLSVLLGAGILAVADAALDTVKQLQDLQTRQVLMGENVAANAQWIKDWHEKLKVPERDQRQDTDIQELKRRMEIIERRQGSE